MRRLSITSFFPYILPLALGAVVPIVPLQAHAGNCPDPEFCAPQNECWDDDVGQDVCTDIPEICEPNEAAFQFLDDLDGDNDGQLIALGNREPYTSCGTVTVQVTGYYSLFDTELSESCNSQRDETGYLTVQNSCNTEGWAVERNAGNRLLVLDSDNSPACSGDPECGPDKVCRADGACCVPAQPTFMGTFLLVADEPNTLCLHHWCPEYLEELAAGNDLGFLLDNCEGINSIHFRVQDALVCEDRVTLNECSFGCLAGECPDDPCESTDCPLYCQNGICLEDNPCDDLDCMYGCVNGYCLQEPDAPGVDADGDGYNELGDCDDGDAAINPDSLELCGNGVDDNCNGAIDEDGCLGGNASGCCSTSDRDRTGDWLLALGLSVLLFGRRRRRQRATRRDPA